MSAILKEHSVEELVRAVLSATTDQKKRIWDVIDGKDAIRVEQPAKRNTALYSVTATAKMLMLSRNSIYGLIDQKRLAVVRITGAPKITGQSIEDFLNGLRPTNAITATMVAQSRQRYARSKNRGESNSTYEKRHQ